MTPALESILSKVAGAVLGFLLTLVGFFFNRTLKKIDHDNAKQKDSLDKLTEKIEGLGTRITDQVQEIRLDLVTLRADFGRDVAAIQLKLALLEQRQDIQERDLNAAMQKVRTELEGLHRSIKETGP